jgi:hypothetical protein
MMSAHTFSAPYRSEQCVEHYLPVAAAEYSEISTSVAAYGYGGPNDGHQVALALKSAV